MSRQKTRWWFFSIVLSIIMFSWPLIFYRLINNHSTKSGDNMKQGTQTQTVTKMKPLPTGLIANWKNKVLKTSHDTQNLQPRATSSLGGLANNDAGGERPKTVVNRYDHYKKNKTRKNEVCLFLLWA